ncbi:MAG: hypothetical protein AAFR42_17460 [Cyanobacteria bacterium J06628_6]
MDNFLKSNRRKLRGVLAVCMIVAGILHFAITDSFVTIVPGFLPFPAALVYISGVIEIVLGTALLVPQVQQLAAWGLVALFIAVYPANINMAVNDLLLEEVPNSWIFHVVRLPLQFVLIAWAYWFTRPATAADLEAPAD